MEHISRPQLKKLILENHRSLNAGRATLTPPFIMSKLQKWLKGQQSKKKEKKGKDGKTNSKKAPVAPTPPAPQVAVSPNRDAKTPRPTLRRRILAAGLHTRPGGPVKTSAAQNMITVIPEGRKEIHISVSELRRPTSTTTEARPASNRLRDDILASVNRAHKQPLPKSVETSEAPSPRAVPTSTKQRESVPLPSKVEESAPIPTVEALVNPPFSVLSNDKSAPKTEVETRPQNFKDENAEITLHDEAEKPTAQPPPKMTRQVSDEIKNSISREPAVDISQPGPSARSPTSGGNSSSDPVPKSNPSQSPTTDESPSRAPKAKSSPILEPILESAAAKSSPIKPDNSRTIPNPTSHSQGTKNPTKSSPSRSNQAVSISTSTTTSKEEKKAMNTSYHYSKTFPPSTLR